MEEELNSKELVDLLSFPLSVFDGEDTLFQAEEQSSNVTEEGEDSSEAEDQSSNRGTSTTTGQNKRKAKKTNKKKRRGKPKRPVSAYILYFQVERKRILENRDDEPLVITPEEVLKVCQDFKAKPKRKHRKSHGQIAFLDLSRTVASRWKSLDKPTKSLFKAQAELETAHYRKLLEAWKQKCDEEDAKEQERIAVLERQQEPPAKKSKVVRENEVSGNNYQPAVAWATPEETTGDSNSRSLYLQAPPSLQAQVSHGRSASSIVTNRLPSLMEPRHFSEQQQQQQTAPSQMHQQGGTNNNPFFALLGQQQQQPAIQVSSNNYVYGMDHHIHPPAQSSATRQVSQEQNSANIVTTPLINNCGLVASEGAPIQSDFRSLCASLCGVDSTTFFD